MIKDNNKIYLANILNNSFTRRLILIIIILLSQNRVIFISKTFIITSYIDIYTIINKIIIS